MTEIYQGYWSVKFNARQFLLDKFGTIATTNAYLNCITVHKIDGIVSSQQTYLKINAQYFILDATGREEKISEVTLEDFQNQINKAVENLVK